jgi:hypothetical protein
MSLVATTRKLRVSFFEYVRDRITRTENIESLAQIIPNKTAPNPILRRFCPKTLTRVGWGATALGGFPDLKQVAFEERNPTFG